MFRMLTINRLLLKSTLPTQYANVDKIFVHINALFYDHCCILIPHTKDDLYLNRDHSLNGQLEKGLLMDHSRCVLIAGRQLFW